MKAKQLRLHGFSLSGNTFKVAFALRHLGLKYDTVHVDYLSGQTREGGWREAVNAMGEAPVLEDGGRRLTQSGAILLHLARKTGKLCGADDEAACEVLRWILFDNHKFTSYFATYRFMRAFAPAAPDPAVLAFLRGRIEGAFGIVDKHLQQREWIVGASPTMADFSLSGYLFYGVEESGFDWPTRYPAIAAWVSRLRGLRGWADPYLVLPGERIQPRWVDSIG
jgi:glutathione S-transferase